MGIFSNFRGENKKYLKPPSIYRVLDIASGFSGFLHQQYGKNDFWMTKDVKTWRVEKNPPVAEGDSPGAVGRSKKSSLFCSLHLEDSAQIGLANNGGRWPLMGWWPIVME